MVRAIAWSACLAGLISTFVGCGASAPPPKPDVKDRLDKLFNLYRAYTDTNRKPPANEQALKEFAAKLSPEERADRLIGDDVEGIFTSPRDNEKFVIKYNIRPDPAVNRALAWEAKGLNGMHFVALTMGYTVEYDEAQLKQYMK